MYYYIYETNMYYDRLIYIYILFYNCSLVFVLLHFCLFFPLPAVSTRYTFIDQYVHGLMHLLMYLLLIKRP